MKFGKGTIALVAAFMILMGSGAAALAQDQPNDTGDATVAITVDPNENFLAVAVTDVDFDEWPYSFTAFDVDGNLTVTVTDTRGTAAGWNVNLSATDFARADNAYFFDIGNLSLLSGGVTDLAYGGIAANATCIAASSLSEVDGLGQEILSADVDCGMGLFELAMNGTLTIPGGTLVGVYESTVTVEFASGA
jgi:hypothetical protein